MLWDAKVTEEALESFITRLSTYLEASSSGRQKTRPTVHRLEKAIDMKTSGMSTTIALSGQVDLEHGGKSQVGLVMKAVVDLELSFVSLHAPAPCRPLGSMLLSWLRQKPRSRWSLILLTGPLSQTLTIPSCDRLKSLRDHNATFTRVPSWSRWPRNNKATKKCLCRSTLCNWVEPARERARIFT